MLRTFLNLSLLKVFLLTGVTFAGDIAFKPTTGDAIPDAIINKAGDPQGTLVHYFETDQRAAGYLAMPAGEGPFPAVILIHEWNGLVDRIRQTADAFAAEGYIALAADLYQGRIGNNRDENIALIQETRASPDTVINNLNAAVNYIRDNTNSTGKIATIGWCFGGGIALSYALGGEQHDGTAIFYGQLLDDPEQMRHIHHEVYGTFAALDQGPSIEQVDAFVAAMRTAGVSNDVHIYDDVNHGFWLHVERDQQHNLPAAKDAWQRLKAYLKRVL